MTAEELLLALKDIQPPPEPAWWQLAPATLIASCLIIGLAAFAWFFAKHRRASRLASLADQDLTRISYAYQQNENSLQLAQDLSKWLKQVSLLAFPERQLAGINGDSWLRFLDESLGGNRFSRGNGKIFGDAVYQPHIDPDADQLLALCKQWLIAVKPHLLQQGRG